MLLVVAVLFLGRVYSFVEELGDTLQVVLPASAYVYSIYDTNDARFQFYTSFIVNFATTELLKNTVQELRPDGRDTRSFPSGHTAVSFMSAGFICTRYGFKRAIPYYLLASFVGFSRIYSNRHYFHDVLAGAVIGTGTSFIVSYFFKNSSSKLIPTVYKYDKNVYYGILVDW